MLSLPLLRCHACQHELVPRSRMPKGVRAVACQNFTCGQFDKPIDPDAQRREEAEFEARCRDE
jgi:hypothetical protein